MEDDRGDHDAAFDGEVFGDANDDGDAGGRQDGRDGDAMDLDARAAFDGDVFGDANVDGDAGGRQDGRDGEGDAGDDGDARDLDARIEVPCPYGYAGTQESGCVPLLTALASSGTLSPQLNELNTSYAIDVGLATQTITLTPEAVPAATIAVEGQIVLSGTPWESPVLALGDNEIAIVVSQAGHPSRSYTLIVARGHQEAYLEAGNNEVNLGSAIALSGDTLVVGAPNAEAVHVFVRVGDSWSQQAILTASNGSAWDHFGVNVALSGDTLVVGAPEYAGDTPPWNIGAAYVFERIGTTWTERAFLQGSYTEGGDFFGDAVAVSADTIVIGVPREDSDADGVNGDESDNSAPWSGAAYVFVRNGLTWTQQAYLKSSNSNTEDSFGNSVAIDGDTIVVGAFTEPVSVGGVDTGGAAYVFARDGDQWSEQARLTASEPDLNFGWGASISGETVVLVAGWGADTMPPPYPRVTGVVYVFVRGAGTWLQQARLIAPDTSSLGFPTADAVAISGERIVVGSTFANELPGPLYVFERSGGSWSSPQYLRGTGNALPNQPMTNVAISGDTLVGLAPFAGGGGVGGIYIFR